MSNAVFYGPEDPAPAILPPWVVVTDNGGWACQSLDQALEVQAQLRANRVGAKIVTVVA